MKVHVIGGGPAGLYFSILMKKAWPATRITVFERNRPDDTFGFGVVFSDQTLDTFESYDRESYRAIIGHFAYWDDIEIHFRGTTHRIGGNGFCGCARGTLLKILGRRARSLGVQIKYESEVSPLDPAIRDANLVVVADGINSRMRDTFADRFKPSVDLRPNFFSWMGSTRPIADNSTAAGRARNRQYPAADPCLRIAGPSIVRRALLRAWTGLGRCHLSGSGHHLLGAPMRRTIWLSGATLVALFALGQAVVAGCGGGDQTGLRVAGCPAAEWEDRNRGGGRSCKAANAAARRSPS